MRRMCHCEEHSDEAISVKVGAHRVTGIASSLCFLAMTLV